MYRTIINILARIGFKEAIHDYCYRHQSKSYKEYMEFAFTDSHGRKYFYFPDLKRLPLPLHEKLLELQEQLNCKLPGRDLDSWVGKVEETLNSNSKTKLTDVSYWLGVLKDRRTILFDPTLLMEIAALLYIREDENPSVYNRQLHKEKFELLWKDSQEGGTLYDFFQQAGLRGYIPSGVTTPIDYQKFLAESKQKIQDFNSALSRISTFASAVKD